MPIITRQCIDQIKTRVNIYDVVQPYVQLKRSGASWRGLSPFTEEKSPSFYALPQKNIFKCFSSGHAGDIFKFLQLKENLNFNEAVETIARRFNIPIEYEENNQHTHNNQSLRKELFTIHELATHYFHQAFLAKTQEGECIRDYFCNQRQFLLKTATTYHIGFSPVNDSGLLDLLLKNQCSLAALKQCGLFYARENDQDPRHLKARFMGRLMIPIRDVQGRVIAFTARHTPLTPKSDPAFDAKYINSPETPLFIKSHVLFNLDIARQHIDQCGSFLIVEGQLDAIRCFEKDIPNAIAPQGTSITEGQLALIRRYTHSLECLLDGDSAGQKAALRLLPMALEAGLEVTFLPLPSQLDPDTLFLSQAANALQSLRDKALPPMAFALKALMPPNPSPQEKSQVFQSIYTMILKCDSVLTQKEYLYQLAHYAYMDRQTIELDFSSFCQNQPTVHSQQSPIQKKLTPDASQKLTTAEYELLLVILHYEGLSQSIASILDPEWIDTTTAYGKFLSRFIIELREHQKSTLFPIDDLLENENEYNFIYTLLAESPPFSNPVHAANFCIKTIFNQFVQKTKQVIEAQIASSEYTQADAFRNLLNQRLTLRKLQAPQLDIQPSLYSNANEKISH